LNLANIVSLLTAQKIGITIAHRRSILKIQKPSEVLFRLYVKMYEFYFVTRSEEVIGKKNLTKQKRALTKWGISSLCSYCLPVEQKEALEPRGGFGLSPEENYLKFFKKKTMIVS
jgi:hypothetical protein